MNQYLSLHRSLFTILNNRYPDQEQLRACVSLHGTASFPAIEISHFPVCAASPCCPCWIVLILCIKASPEHVQDWSRHRLCNVFLAWIGPVGHHSCRRRNARTFSTVSTELGWRLTRDVWALEVWVVRWSFACHNRLIPSSLGHRKISHAP